MLLIPLNPVPYQILSTQLAGQDCRIAVYARETGLYLALAVADVLLLPGVICLDRTKIVRDAYLGFVGDLAFSDAQGTTDPVVAGLGSRYRLVYLETADL